MSARKNQSKFESTNKKAILKSYHVKVGKFQKQIFLFSFEPKKGTKLFLNFCPKDVKYVESKNKGTYYVKYPLINVIKSLHFYDLTHF